MLQPPTITDLAKHGFEVHATCGGCGRSKKLDLTALAVAHGETGSTALPGGCGANAFAVASFAKCAAQTHLR